MVRRVDTNEGLMPLLSKCERELDILFRVAETLTRAGSLESLASGILNEIVSFLESVEAGVLYLYDRQTKSLLPKAAHGYNWKYISQLTQSPGEGIVGKSYKTCKQIFLNNRKSIENLLDTLTKSNKELLKNASPSAGYPLLVLCTPLVADSKPIGALILENFSNQSEEKFFEGFADFVQALCNLISISISKVLLEQELKNAIMLRERERMKSDLVDLLSHEIRTPLSSIKGYVTLLLKGDTVFDSLEMREFLEIVDNETDVITALVTDILDSAAIEAGSFLLNLEPVILTKIVEKIIQESASRVKRHKIIMSFPKPFPIVIGDWLRLEQVMRNLLDNAIKYSDGGLIVIKGKVQDDEVIVSVADQGVGIKPEHLNRLFDRYYRIRTEGKRIVGTGLGLPIAREIIDRHGGRIWASSDVGRGSTFYFTLPLNRAPSIKGGVD